MRRSDWMKELMPLFTASIHEVLVSNRALSSTVSSYNEKEGHLLRSIFNHIALIPQFSCKGSTHAFRTSMKDISHSCHKVIDWLHTTIIISNWNPKIELFKNSLRLSHSLLHIAGQIKIMHWTLTWNLSNVWFECILKQVNPSSCSLLHLSFYSLSLFLFFVSPFFLIPFPVLCSTFLSISFPFSVASKEVRCKQKLKDSSLRMPRGHAYLVQVAAVWVVMAMLPAAAAVRI